MGTERIFVVMDTNILMFLNNRLAELVEKWDKRFCLFITGIVLSELDGLAKTMKKAKEAKADIAFLLEKFANRVWIQYDSGRSFICTRYNHPRPDAQIENACDFMEKV